MESINPHFQVSPPTYFVNRPMDCKYYAGASCLREKHAPMCEEENCENYKYEKEPQIITLCGSTRFKDLFFKAARDLTLQGWIVLMPGVFGHADNFKWTEETKQKLDELHLEKIRLSNAIFVLNYGGYIGESTQKEINFAEARGIPIYKYE